MDQNNGVSRGDFEYVAHGIIFLKVLENFLRGAGFIFGEGGIRYAFCAGVLKKILTRRGAGPVSEVALHLLLRFTIAILWDSD